MVAQVFAAGNAGGPVARVPEFELSPIPPFALDAELPVPPFELPPVPDALPPVPAVAGQSAPATKPPRNPDRLRQMDDEIDAIWAAMERTAVHVRAFLRWADWLTSQTEVPAPRWASDEAKDLRFLPWLLELVASIDRPVPFAVPAAPDDPSAPLVIRNPHATDNPRGILADVATEVHHCGDLIREWVDKFGPGEPYGSDFPYVRDLTGLSQAIEHATSCLWGNLPQATIDAAWDRFTARLGLTDGDS